MFINKQIPYPGFINEIASVLNANYKNLLNEEETEQLNSSAVSQLTEDKCKKINLDENQKFGIYTDYYIDGQYVTSDELESAISIIKENRDK